MAISVLVAVHEFGHFIVARKLGFKVLRFSIGFGRPLLSWRGGPPDHIEYWLSTIPLGGYVKMLDEHEGPVVSEDRHRAFHQRPVWQRVAVLLAGPGFNFLFAILAFWLMFVTGVQALKPIIGSVEPGSVAARARPHVRRRDRVHRRAADADVGKPPRCGFSTSCSTTAASISRSGSSSGATRTVELDVRGREQELTEPAGPFEALGLEPGQAAVVDSVVEGSPAERAGLGAGDRVIRGNGKPIEDWDQWVEFTQSQPGATVDVTVLRGDRELTLTATLDTIDGGRQDVRPHRRQWALAVYRAALRDHRVAAARRRARPGR